MSEQSLTSESASDNDDVINALDPTELADENAPVDAGATGADAPPAVDADEEARSEVETRATALGWKPKDKFRGPNWVDAKTFVETNDRLVPYIRRENKVLEARVQQAERRAQALEAELAETRAWREEQRSAQSQVKKEMLIADKAAALENQDYQAVAKIDEQLADMRESAKSAPAKAAPAQPQFAPEVVNAVQEFERTNPVYSGNKVLQAALGVEAKALRDAGFQGDVQEILDTAHDRVRRLYPEKFARKRTGTPMAETGGSPGGTRGMVRSWDNLTEESRKAFEGVIRRNPSVKKEAILKEASAEDFRR